MTFDGIRWPMEAGMAPDRSSGGPNEADKHAQRRAWQREMERAQLAAWFLQSAAPATPHAPLPQPGTPSSSEARTASTMTAAEATSVAGPRHTTAHAPMARHPGAREVGVQVERRSASAIESPAPVEAPALVTDGPTRHGPATDVSTVTSALPPLDLPAAMRLDAGQVIAGLANAPSGWGVEWTAQGVPPLSLASVRAASVATQLQFAPVPPQHPVGPKASATAEAEPVHRAPEATSTVPSRRNPPVRLHAEWGADGVRLWLGLDAAILAHRHVIADQVRRWMQGQGVRVLSLWCNGESLPDPLAAQSVQPATETQSRQTKEKPWPSAR